MSCLLTGKPRVHTPGKQDSTRQSFFKVWTTLYVACCAHSNIHELKAETVKVPQMAESISEGTLKSWLKQPGEFVNADEEVATIETDKASTLPSASCSSDPVGRRVTCDTATYRTRSPIRFRPLGGP